MKNIRHQATERDSLYMDIEGNLDAIYAMWAEGNNSLRFSIPILCTAKLEAFINVAGTLNVERWDNLERRLSFPEKCKKVFAAVGLSFDPGADVNKAAIAMFDIRHELVHPKMKLKRIDEYVSQAEYEQRSKGDSGVKHPLRSKLTKEEIKRMKTASDAFVSTWGQKLLEGFPEYWLGSGSTGGFTFDQHRNNQ